MAKLQTGAPYIMSKITERTDTVVGTLDRYQQRDVAENEDLNWDWST